MINFNKYIKVALFVGIILSLGGCNSKNPQANNDVKNQNIVSNSNEEKKPHYEITREMTKINSEIFFYPQIKNYRGELLMDYMNQSLKIIVNKYKDENLYSKVNIDYQITRMDEKILSVVFKGTAYMKNIGKINIQESINLDVGKTSNEINYSNFIKNTEQAQKAIKERLDQEAKRIGIKEGFEAEGIRIYFKGENVVFYYMPMDDSAKEFVELTIPEKEIADYINSDFGEAPKS